jgi:glycosyltransferase involved in cell wall biosynthesis
VFENNLLETLLASLSLVLPAYNEERLIGGSLDALLAYLAPRYQEFEILVVDDGSRDETAVIVEGYQRQPGSRVKLIQNPGNRGKGFSVRQGMMAAVCDLVIFMDADLPFDLEVIPFITQALQNGADAAVGSRVLPASKMNVSIPPVRFIAGQVFSLLIQALLFRGIPDTQCGVKGFRLPAAREIFRRQTIWNFGFDVEVLFITRKLGYRVQPVPVRQLNSRADSKVHILQDSLKSFIDLALIRWNDIRGVYS